MRLCLEFLQQALRCFDELGVFDAVATPLWIHRLVFDFLVLAKDRHNVGGSVQRAGAQGDKIVGMAGDRVELKAVRFNSDVRGTIAGGIVFFAKEHELSFLECPVLIGGELLTGELELF